MPTYKLTISYEGTRYSGWQRQDERRACGKKKTIQGILEETLSKIFCERISLVGSGRTDAGVHALAQVAHFRSGKAMEPERLALAVNGLLPFDIALSGVELVPADFNARFCAVSKVYRYLIVESSLKDPFLRNFAFFWRSNLNIALMRSEARVLVGRHNFKSFQASERVEKKSVTEVFGIRVRRLKNLSDWPFLSSGDFIAIDIEAGGFLRNMVRNIAGTLFDLGRGKLKKGDMLRILQSRDRTQAGLCAPARGLYLLRVKYE